MLQSLRHRVPSAVLGERQFGFAPTDGPRIHDLVGLTMFQDSILMNAGTMCKGVLAHDRFAASHNQTAHPTNQSPRFQDAVIIDLSVEIGEVVGPRFDCHHYLFNCRVPSTFADAVYGYFDLARTRLYRGKRVCHGHAKIIMAMHADDCFFDMIYIRL